MSITSLVPCPACFQRRNFVGIYPHRRGSEIRVFNCAACVRVTAYLFEGRKITELSPNEMRTDLEKLPAFRV